MGFQTGGRTYGKPTEVLGAVIKPPSARAGAKARMERDEMERLTPSYSVLGHAETVI